MAVAGLFVIVDLAFVSANMMKVFEGGWFPLVVAAIVFFLMSTWRQGRDALLRTLERDTLPLSEFHRAGSDKTRVPGTAVYMTSRLDVVPVPLLHNLKHNKVLHERIVLLHVVTANIPRVAPRAAHRSRPSWRQFPFHRRALRLHGAAGHSARRLKSAAPSNSTST